jgi:hypothetical protein
MAADMMAVSQRGDALVIRRTRLSEFEERTSASPRGERTTTLVFGRR